MKSKLKSKQTEMRILCGTILAAAVAVAVTANAETIFEAKGLVTDRTPGFRFGNVTFTDNDRVCAKFEQIEMTEGAKGRLTTKKLRLPHKEPGKGAYFKFSFDAKYEFTSGKADGKPQRCNQGVFFYDKQGRVLPDCYDTMYPGKVESVKLKVESEEAGKVAARHYERVLYAWDETTPCYTWLFGSGLPFEWYSRDAVHSGEYGKQIIGRIMLGYFMTGKQ